MSGSMEPNLSDNVRYAVCRAMWAEMDRWMPEYGQSITALARGLVDGHLTEQVIQRYPTDHSYPEQYSRAIAHQVGLYFADDAAADEPADDEPVSAEGIGLAIEALRAIVAGEADIHDGNWGFYPGTLSQFRVSVEQVRQVFRETGGLLGAAWLVRDAVDASPDKTRP